MSQVKSVTIWLVLCISWSCELVPWFWFAVNYPHSTPHAETVHIPHSPLSCITGCMCLSEFSTFWFTKSCMDSHRNTLVHSTMSLTCLAADLSVLLAPTVCQCRRLSWQPSPTNRAFSVVGPRTWDNLPDDVTSAESLPSFHQQLKTHLFSKSVFSNGPTSGLYYEGHFKNPGSIDWHS